MPGNLNENLFALPPSGSISMLANQEEILASIRRERANLTWVTDSLSKLRKEFGDQFVAVRDRVVIDHDKDLDKLLARVRKSEAPESVTIEFVSALELIWML